MLCDMTRRCTVETWIVHDFDLPAERAKAGAPVERKRGRMIEGAGVQPDAFHLARPRKLERAVH